MALSLLQSGAFGGNLGFASGTAQQVLPGPCGIGTAVAVAITVNSTTAGTVSSVTSSMGTFTRVNDVVGVGGNDCTDVEWWVCTLTTASADTITVTTTGAVAWCAIGFEVLGGVSSAASGGSSEPGTGSENQLTPTAAVGSMVLVAGTGLAFSLSIGLAPPGSPWVNLPTPGTSGQFLYASWQVAAAANPAAVWFYQSGNSTNLLGLVLVPDSPAPPAPTLTSPVNASFDNVSSGLAFSATYNAAGSDGMGDYAMRIKVSGGSYSYWNAGTNALQSSIVWNPDSVLPNNSFGPTLPSSAISNGNIYNWSLACEDAVSGGQGPFATDNTFTAQAAPTVTVTAPTGTVASTTSPTAQWTATPAPGLVQIAYSIIVESGSFGSVPGSGTQVWASGLITSALNQAQIAATLVNGTSYRVFVQIEQTGGQTSAWGFSSFTISTDTPAIPLITATQTTDPSTGCPMIQLTVQGLDNYLTTADSTFEDPGPGGIGSGGGDAGTWVAVSGCSLANSTSQAFDGTHSEELLSNSTSSMVAETGLYPVLTGELLRFMGHFRANTTARTCTLTAAWFNSGSPVSTTTIGTATDSTSAWTAISGTATVPAGVNQVKLEVTIASTVSSEGHFIDGMGIFPGAATAWSVGGFVGLTKAVITRSDNVFVRWASANNPLPIPTSNQLATVNDYECVPSVNYSWSAVVQVGGFYIVNGQNPVASPPNVSAVEDIPPTFGWWELNPAAGTATTNPSAVNAQMVGWTPVQTEQATANQVINQPTMNVVSNAMMAQDFAGTVETFKDTIYQAFNALLTGQQTIFISSPWGAIDSGYFRIGPQSGGMSSGMGTTAKSTTLMPSVSGAGHRTTAITAIAQPRPSV